MAVLLQDAFTDTNGVQLRNHAPDIGGTWQDANDRWQISSNTLINDGVHTNTAYDSYMDLNTITYPITYKSLITHNVGGNPKAGLTFRLNGTSCLRLHFQSEANTIYLDKISSGAVVAIDSTTVAMSIGTAWDSFNIVDTGSNVKVYYDADTTSADAATLVMNQNNSDFNTNTQVGFHDNNTGSSPYFDNVYAEDSLVAKKQHQIKGTFEFNFDM